MDDRTLALDLVDARILHFWDGSGAGFGKCTLLFCFVLGCSFCSDMLE